MIGFCVAGILVPVGLYCFWKWGYWSGVCDTIGKSNDEINDLIKKKW